MRNRLLILALLVVSVFSTSSVFAEGFDKSKRSERLGLSFYDGRPLYVASFTVPYVSGYGSNFDLYRVNSGDSLSNYGDFDSPTYSDCRCEYVRENGAIVQRLFFFYCVDDDGEPVLLGGDAGTSNFADLSFVKRAFASTTFSASSGDLGLSVTDELFGVAKDIFIEFLPFIAGIFALVAGSKYFEHFAKTGVMKEKKGVPTWAKRKYFTLEKETDPFSLETPKSIANKDIEPGKDLEQIDSVRESYITGSRWGREFSDEVRESNRKLLDSFDSMDEFTRSLLIQRFEEMSFFQEVDFLKSYRSYYYGGGDDHQNGNPFVDESDFAQTPWGGAPFGGGDFDDANRILDEEYYDSYDGACDDNK